MFIPRDFSVWLPIHDDLPENDRPKFKFRGSTWAERQEVLSAGEGWEDLGELQIIGGILPLLKRHLISAPFAGEIENELDYVQIVELYSRMRIGDQISALAKKKFVLPSPSETDNSTQTNT